MSGYSETYHSHKNDFIVRQYCPAWAANERFQVRAAIAEGVKAQKELAELKNALAQVRRVLGT